MHHHSFGARGKLPKKRRNFGNEKHNLFIPYGYANIVSEQQPLIPSTTETRVMYHQLL